MPVDFWIEEYRRKAAVPNPWVQSGRTSTFTVAQFLYVHRDTLELLDLRPEHDVLDIGCANGLFDILLSTACRRLLAVEPVEELATIARATLAGCPNVRVEVGHGAAIPVDDRSFDRVLMLGVTQLVPPHELDDIFGELQRVTRSGGRIVLGSILNAHHRDHFLNAYLGTVHAATHLSPAQKTEITDRNLRAYWYDPAELAARLSDIGQVSVHSLPAMDPTAGHRFNLCVSIPNGARPRSKATGRSRQRLSVDT